MTKIFPRKLLACALGAALAGCAAGALADERAEYERRVVERYNALFEALDRDRDGRVTREEATGDVNFVPVFQDMDIDRNGVVTLEELRRFLELRQAAR